MPIESLIQWAFLFSTWMYLGLVLIAWIYLNPPKATILPNTVHGDAEVFHFFVPPNAFLALALDLGHLAL